MIKPIALNEQYEPKLKTAREQLKTLETRAGVAKAVERAGSGRLFPLHYDSKAAFGTAQRQREREEYLYDERSYARGGIRGVYLSVADVDLRKQLISHYREIARLWAAWQELEARQRQVALAELKLGNPSEVAGWLIAAVTAAAISAIGYGVAGLPGTVGSAELQYFWGRRFNRACSKILQENTLLEYATQNRASLRRRSWCRD